MHIEEASLPSLLQDSWGKMIYLASPYNDPSPAVRAERATTAGRIANWFLSFGVIVYAPVSYGHHVSGGIDSKRWLSHGLVVLSRSSMVLVAPMAGWGQSVGMEVETTAARLLNIPVRILREADLDRALEAR